MQIVVVLFHCHFLSNVYFLSSFVKCVITIFGFTMCYYYVGFGNREICSVGQLVHQRMEKIVCKSDFIYFILVMGIFYECECV